MSAPELELEAWSDPEWEAELEPVAERIRMALAEAGYPDADVYVDPTGVMVAELPDDHQECGERIEALQDVVRLGRIVQEWRAAVAVQDPDTPPADTAHTGCPA
jgi:hypothetical protein